MLNDKGRIKLDEDVLTWRRRQLEQGMIEIAVDGETGIRAASLEKFHPDPADRIIVATALAGPPSGNRRLTDSWLVRSTRQTIRSRLKPHDNLQTAHPLQPQ